MTDIARNIAQVREEMTAACHRAGRKPENVALVAVSKYQSVERMAEVVAAGILAFGENHAQELTEKKTFFEQQGCRVHFIGQLQTNKIKYVCGFADLIESVDRQNLAQQLQQKAQARGIVQDILLEVNIGKEANKGGILPDALPALVEYVKNSNGIRLRGLMCIPPADASEHEVRSFFVQTRQLFVDTAGKMGDNASNIDSLSMGMSSDFSVAIEEGATMVRVGTAIFGLR